MRTKLVVSLFIVALLGWYMWPESDQGGAADAARSAPDQELLLDRLWIDHLPRSESEKFHILVMLADPAVGAFTHTSQFEGDFAAFSWVPDRAGARARYRLTMLQARTEHSVRMSVSDKGCGPFDYCLTVQDAPRGPTRYVSMEDWDLEGSGAVDPSALRALIASRIRDLPRD